MEHAAANRRRRSPHFPRGEDFTFDILRARLFVEWPRRERGGDKYKSDLAFRLCAARFTLSGETRRNRRDKKKKKGKRRNLFSLPFCRLARPLFLSSFPPLLFRRHFRHGSRLIGEEKAEWRDASARRTFRQDPPKDVSLFN